MRQYVTLAPTFWIGNTGQALRNAGPTVQLVALYLISNPHANYIGLYRLPLAYARTDLNMTEKSLLKAFATLEKLGFAKFDTATEMVWVFQGARYQIGERLAEKDRRVKFVQGEYFSVPAACPMKTEFFSKYAEAYGLSETPVVAKRAQSAQSRWEPTEDYRQAGLRDI